MGRFLDMPAMADSGGQSPLRNTSVSASERVQRHFPRAPGNDAVFGPHPRAAVARSANEATASIGNNATHKQVHFFASAFGSRL
jgi:hypothetical protein